ncbi:hypothetical protein ERJ75_001160400 [Trypanosoma vivax]|nr:hypothetical protein ERJ75_001160400 [Trypanosoma vivax]
MHHKDATVVRRKMKDGTVAATPSCNDRSSAHAANEVALKQHPTTPWRRSTATEKGGQAQLAEGLVQGVCGAPPAVPKLARAKEEARSGNPEGRGVVLQRSTGQLLEGTLQAGEHIRSQPDEPESRPARAVKRHRSPTELDTPTPLLWHRSGLGCALQEACESMSGKPIRHPRQSASKFPWMKRGWDLGCVQRPLRSAESGDRPRV